MNKEEKLEELKRKRRNYQDLLEQVNEQIAKLEYELRDKLQYKDYIKKKYCIVCANRIPEHDFKIPDGIVCGHPSNKNGKDRFQSTHHTCKYWKQEEKE
jgi:hypothetical protein